MATEQYFGEVAAQQHTDSSEEDRASVGKWKSVSATADGCENNQSGGFDCNICLDFVHEPVVTLCGHLYCWPCIYKWIYIQNFAAEIPDQQQPECPVCKAEISQGTLVPLYGRGQTGKSLEGEGPHLGIMVPRRPPGPTGGVHILDNYGPSQLLYRRGYPQQSLPYHPQQSLPYHPHRGSYPATPMVSLGGTMMTEEIRPMVGMFGEMLYARIFGNSETTLYAYPNSHHLAGSSSPRVRRHLMQTDKSLGRVCFFLFCCMVLCLLLF